jgi:hypothetical protein
MNKVNYISEVKYCTSAAIAIFFKMAYRIIGGKRMKENETLKIVLGLIFSLILFQISCQQEKEQTFIGYDDLLVNSPMLLWGSSIEEFKNKYPDIEEFGNSDDQNFTEQIFTEQNFNGKINARYFRYFNNKLYMVHVSYGNYSNNELDSLKDNLQKKYGINLIEDNGTIETWYLEGNEDTQIVFLINKVENNMLNCSYINPHLRDEIIILE